MMAWWTFKNGMWSEMPNISITLPTYLNWSQWQRQILLFLPRFMGVCKFWPWSKNYRTFHFPVRSTVDKGLYSRYEMWMNTPPFLPCRVLLFNYSVTQSPCGISRVCGQMMLIQSRQIPRQNLLTPAVFDESPSSKPSCCEVLARLWLASTMIFKPGCTCFQC